MWVRFTPPHAQSKQPHPTIDTSDASHPLLSPPTSPASPKPSNELQREDDTFNPSSPTSLSVLRKIDRRLIPLLFITYNLNFMDKTILSSASVFGLREDTGLEGQEYSFVSAIFYLGYFLWAYPTSFLVLKWRVGWYVGVNTVSWGVVVALTAACTNFGGLLVVRFLLGVAEATISPAFVLITSTWYTRSEIPVRTGIWFAGNALGGVFSSFIAFGLGHVHHPLHPWQWLFIILGGATFLWGFVLLYLLPDCIATASFLTPEERVIAQQRIKASGTGQVQNTYNAYQASECILDPKTWLIFAISLLSQIPNSGTQNFGNLVLQGFGFTSLQTTLVILPASCLSFAFIIGTGRLAGKHANISTYLICLVVVPPLIGSAIIHAGASRGIKLLAYYLLSTGPTALPLLLSLVGSNYKGSTKKMTVTALLFVAYCAGNMIGPQLFKTSEAPRYNTAFEGIMVSYGFVIVLALGLRFWLLYVNRRRNREERGMLVDEDDNGDKTDFATKGFRYHI